MNYTEALEYIHGVSWTFCKPGLERISALCSSLGHPEKSLRFVHVAGTNGKGSFCSMLSSVLKQAGLKVGLYTSPYVKVFNERMQINGENITDAELASLTGYIKPFADAMEDKPTEFELITALAFEFFKRHECDVVVLEAGLGGRLDSTNVIRSPLLSVITGIALEHTAILGDTVEKIAYEKAGIIKDGSPVLYGGDDETAAEVIAGVAKERGSVFLRTHRDRVRVSSATLDGSVFDYGKWQDVQIPLLGLYQPGNTALVLDAVEVLRARGFNITDADVRRGLTVARWPARFEILHRDPLVIFDGAHNPQGIEQATRSIKHYFGGEKVYLLTGVLKDKDYTGIAAMLSKVVSRAFVMTPPSPRALDASDYAETLRSAGIDAEAFESIESAYRFAVSEAKKDGMPLVCLGSLYVYAEICGL